MRTSKRAVLAALIALGAVAIVVPATIISAQETPSIQAVPIAASSETCLNPLTQRTHRRYVRAVYRREHISQRARERIRRMQKCAKSKKARKNMYGVLHGARKARKRWAVIQRRIDAVTPFRGPNGTRWAIPYSVVACEGGWNGWSTMNRQGSGAAGPYQLLGWGAPMPANTPTRRARHHEIARRLYRASGLGPWTASRSCWG